MLELGKGSTFWVLEKGVSEVQESLQQMSFTRSFQAEHLQGLCRVQENQPQLRAEPQLECHSIAVHVEPMKYNRVPPPPNPTPSPTL